MSDQLTAETVRERLLVARTRTQEAFDALTLIGEAYDAARDRWAAACDAEEALQREILDDPRRGAVR